MLPRATRRALPAVLLALVTVAGLACSSTSNDAAKTTATPPAAAASTSTTRPATTAAVSPSVAPTSAAARTAAVTATPRAVSYPRTVKRSDGKDLVIKSQPKHIASLSAGTTEILYAVGAGDQVAAVDKYSNYPVDAKQKPQLDGFRPSPEAIAGVSPDLVLLVDNPMGIVATLDGLGVAVLYLKVPGSITELLDQMQLYGDISGHGAEAQGVVAAMQARIDAVQAKLAGVTQGPRFYHELDAKLFTAAPNSFIGDLYTLLKAQNVIATGDRPYPQVTQELVVAKDPEVILLADATNGETPDTVKARPGWSVISAVKSNRVYPIDGDLISRPGPRIVDALETLAKLLYPDRF